MDRITEQIIRGILNIDGYISTDTLAELLKISSSNIKHNLPQIKKELERFGAELLSAPKKGICMIASDEQRHSILQAISEEVSKNSEFYVHRKEYILETLYIFNANYTVQLFADELAVSKNTIIKDLEQINNELAKYNVSIKKVRNQGVVLEGYEFNIRQAMIETYNSKYWNWSSGIIVESTGDSDLRVSKKAFTYLSNTYSIKDVNRIQDLLRNAEKSLNIQFTDISFCRLLEYIEIMRQRVRMDKYITEDYTSNQKIEIDESYNNAASEIIHSLFPAFWKCKSCDMEIKYLAARLFVAARYINCKNEISENYRNAAIDFLTDIEEILGTQILNSSVELINLLSQFFEQIKVREIFQILDWDDLYCDIREQSSNIYAVCVANAYKMEERLNIRLHQDDVAWVTLLIDNCLKDKRNKISTIFVHGTNEYIAMFQKRLIESQIPELYISDMIYFSHFKNEDNQLIISTVPFKRKKKNVIEVTKHINQNDISLIKERVHKIDGSGSDSEIQEIIEEVFQEKIIEMKLNASTKEEVLINMSEMLKKWDYVDETFTEKLLNAESKCSTAIGNAVAIPHYYHESIHSNKIAIAKLRYPVEWDSSEKVNLVFLLAIRYEEKQKINLLFRYFYKLIDDKEMIQKIRRAPTEKQILDILFNFKI